MCGCQALSVKSLLGLQSIPGMNAAAMSPMLAGLCAARAAGAWDKAAAARRPGKAWQKSWHSDLHMPSLAQN